MTVITHLFHLSQSSWSVQRFIFVVVNECFLNDFDGQRLCFTLRPRATPFCFKRAVDVARRWMTQRVDWKSWMGEWFIAEAWTLPILSWFFFQEKLWKISRSKNSAQIIQLFFSFTQFTRCPTQHPDLCFDCIVKQVLTCNSNFFPSSAAGLLTVLMLPSYAAAVVVYLFFFFFASPLTPNSTISSWEATVTVAVQRCYARTYNLYFMAIL